MVCAVRGSVCRMISICRTSAVEDRALAVVRHELDRNRQHAPDTTSEALTDEEITAAARGDPDNPPLTDDELHRVAVARDVQRVRAAVGLSQEAFALRYGIPVGTLRQWEMGRRSPDRATLSYLKVIAAMPAQVAEALQMA